MNVGADKSAAACWDAARAKQRSIANPSADLPDRPPVRLASATSAINCAGAQQKTPRNARG